MSVTDAARELRAVADRRADMTPILRVVAADIKAYIDDRFEQSNAPDGSGWPELSEATISANPRRAGGRPLLDTGRLRASITTEVGPRELRFGTNVIYAAKQNFGDESNMFGGHVAPVPARQYLPISRDGRRLEPDSFWNEQISRIEHWLATGEVR